MNWYIGRCNLHRPFIFLVFIFISRKLVSKNNRIVSTKNIFTVSELKLIISRQGLSKVCRGIMYEVYWECYGHCFFHHWLGKDTNLEGLLIINPPQHPEGSEQRIHPSSHPMAKLRLVPLLAWNQCLGYDAVAIDVTSVVDKIATVRNLVLFSTEDMDLTYHQIQCPSSMDSRF